MAKSKRRPSATEPKLTAGRTRVPGWMVAAGVVLTLAAWAGFQFAKNRVVPNAARANSMNTSALAAATNSDNPPPSPLGEGTGVRALQASSPPGTGQGSLDSARDQSASSSSAPLPAAGEKAGPPTLEVAQAVMVTVELDFGAKMPSIAAALLDIERHYQPDDGKGRTFAILDAYGEPPPTGKLHMSMHVSTEKPGLGSLIFKRTGEVLWSSRIVPSKDPTKRQFTGKNLSIFIDDGAGHLLTIDGSNNPTWIMDALVKERAALLDTVWPSGVEHEVTFIYSACGCPVKVMARREGDRVVRTKELPVMFPDDTAAVELIGRLMRW